MFRRFFWWFGTNRSAILQNAAREICSTNEGQEFARKFLADCTSVVRGYIAALKTDALAAKESER